MKPVVLFRHSRDSLPEMEVCQQYFSTVDSRTECCLDGRRGNGLVIGRYSVLPYYRELVKDLAHYGCRLINSAWEHEWIANFEYYEAVKEYTPESWREHEMPYCSFDGSFIVKGMTNSRKHQWNTHMFANNKREAMEIAHKLHNDMMLAEQELIFRKYVPLKRFETGINGLPFCNEWRFFYYKTTMLTHNFYWSSLDDMSKPYIDQDAIRFADHIASIVSKYTTFFVLDIAEKESGGWILIEINDGQMSGLSTNDPHVLYSELQKALKQEGKFDEVIKRF